VMLLTAVFLKAGCLTGTLGLAMALTAFEVSLAFRIPFDELGVPGAGAFEKKLAIDRCPGCDPALEVCFFKGRGLAGVAFTASFGFPILINQPRGLRNGI
jgi:hypothetical protein